MIPIAHSNISHNTPTTSPIAVIIATWRKGLVATSFLTTRYQPTAAAMAKLVNAWTVSSNAVSSCHRVKTYPAALTAQAMRNNAVNMRGRPVLAIMNRIASATSAANTAASTARPSIARRTAPTAMIANPIAEMKLYPRPFNIALSIGVTSSCRAWPPPARCRDWRAIPQALAPPTSGGPHGSPFRLA